MSWPAVGFKAIYATVYVKEVNRYSYSLAVDERLPDEHAKDEIMRQIYDGETTSDDVEWGVGNTVNKNYTDADGNSHHVDFEVAPNPLRQLEAKAASFDHWYQMFQNGTMSDEHSKDIAQALFQEFSKLQHKINTKDY